MHDDQSPLFPCFLCCTSSHLSLNFVPLLPVLYIITLEPHLCWLASCVVHPSWHNYLQSIWHCWCPGRQTAEMSDNKQDLGEPKDETFLCPICGAEKASNRDNRRALRPEHMRVLVAGDRCTKPIIDPLLSSHYHVLICRRCKGRADRALVAAQNKYQTPAFQTTDSQRKTTVALQDVLHVRFYSTPSCPSL